MELRSKQLADLVGVSVRTLRHYHQIGLLAEPERSYNDYRLYDLDHVLQLLRIRRLSSLGLSLGVITTMLDNLEGMDSRNVLEQLDRDLEQQIRDLKNKRRTVHAILRSGTTLDVLPEFAEYINVLKSNGTGSDSIEADKLLIEIVNGVGQPEEIQTLHELLQFITEEPYVTLFNNLDTRFQDINADSSEQDISELSHDYAAAISNLRQRFLETHNEAQWPDSTLGALLDSLVHQKLNDQQLQVINQIAAITRYQSASRIPPPRKTSSARAAAHPCHSERTCSVPCHFERSEA